MLLCIDIGNTNVVVGACSDGQWTARFRLRTVLDKMPDEYAMLLKDLLLHNGIPLSAVDAVAIASVVPALSGVFTELCEGYLRQTPLVIGPGVRSGLKIRVDNPVELGADLVADAVAAYDRFKAACVVIDFGTATTFSAVSGSGEYLGVAIAPGLALAAGALSGRTAQLPTVSLTAPRSAIGKNTVHSMQAGLIYGYAGLVDGIIRRIREELGRESRVIATGGHARVIGPHCALIEEIDPWLTLEGVRIIHERNQQSKAPCHNARGGEDTCNG
jgi:type III pantothenate kinase